MARGGTRPGAGRKPGTPNKRTLEALQEAALAVAESKKPGGKKLAKYVLEDFMLLFAGMATFHQPLPPGVIAPSDRRPDEAKFQTYAKLAVDTAAELVGYQSPKFKALAVYAAPDQAPASAPGDDAKPVGGNVIELNDAAALERVYKNMIGRVG